MDNQQKHLSVSQYSILSMVAPLMPIVVFLVLAVAFNNTFFACIFTIAYLIYCIMMIIFMFGRIFTHRLNTFFVVKKLWWQKYGIIYQSIDRKKARGLNCKRRVSLLNRERNMAYEQLTYLHQKFPKLIFITETHKTVRDSLLSHTNTKILIDDKLAPRSFNLTQAFFLGKICLLCNRKKVCPVRSMSKSKRDFYFLKFQIDVNLDGKNALEK